MRAYTGLLLLTATLAGCIGGTDDIVEQTTIAETPAFNGGFSSTAVFPGTYDLDGDWAQALREGPYEILTPEIATLQSMLDGAQIQIGLVMPDVPEGTKVPVIVHATPYLFQGMTPEGILREFEYEWRVENFVPHGYAYALLPIRGTSNQGGCMDLMGPAERHDLDQAVTWLGEQEWSNGAVGIVGLSYDGSTPWEVASMGNPYLKTIVPISGVNDIHDLMFNNGTSEFRGPLLLNALYYEYGFVEYNAVQNGRSPQHMLQGLVCPESWEGFYASMHSAFLGERDPLGFWAERDSRPGVEEKYTGSIFLVQGLQDWNVDPHHSYPWVNTLEEKGLVVKHLLGQWDHAFPDRTFSRGVEPHPRMDWAEMLLHWFDYWLKGDTTVDLGPVAQVQDSQGKWRNEDAWPPKDAVATALYLTPDGTLASEPATSEGTTPVTLDPSRTGLVTFAALGAACAACPAFDTVPFGEEFRFAGLPTAHLTVTPHGPGGHLTATLYALDGPDMKRIGWGQIDLRFADGGTTMKPVVPGEPLLAKLQIEPLDAVVPAGAALRLVVSQGAYGDHMHSVPTFPVELHVGGEQSVLTVHVIERGPEVFFEPPRVE